MAVSLMASPAWANTVEYFTDTTNYWPGYPSSAGNDWIGTSILHTPDNGRDNIGNPILTGGIVTFNDLGQLISVGIAGSGYHTGMGYAPGDLFLSTTGNSANWNYVVKTYPGTAHNDASSGSGNPKTVYSGSIPLSGGAGAYLMTGADGNADWKISGPNGSNTLYNIRNDHPYALGNFSGLTPFDAAIYSGFIDGGYTIWTFDTPISITGDFLYIGWTISCANDVVYANVPVPQVPEPSTLLLLGVGLIGAAGIRKKLKK